MNKQEIMQEYKEQEEKLLVAKILDKLEFTKTKNNFNMFIKVVFLNYFISEFSSIILSVILSFK